MPVIETLSVAEACTALGLRPPAVRQRIQSGELAAVQIGRRWRVGLASVNDLLAGADPSRMRPAPAFPGVPRQSDHSISTVQNTAATPAPASSQPAAAVTLSVPDAQPDTAQPVARTVAEPHAQQPATISRSVFDTDDMRWINRYRIELASPDPQVRADAEYHLRMFAQRAERDATRRVAAKMSEDECRTMAAITDDLTGRKNTSCWF